MYVAYRCSMHVSVCVFFKAMTVENCRLCVVVVKRSDRQLCLYLFTYTQIVTTTLIYIYISINKNTYTHLRLHLYKITAFCIWRNVILALLRTTGNAVKAQQLKRHTYIHTNVNSHTQVVFIIAISIAAVVVIIIKVYDHDHNHDNVSQYDAKNNSNNNGSFIVPDKKVLSVYVCVLF